MEPRNITATAPTGRMSESARQAGMLRTLLQVLMGTTALMYLDLFFTRVPLAVFAVVTLALLTEGASWMLLRRGRVRLASLLLITGLWVLLTAGMFVADMRGNAPWIALTIVVLIAGFSLGSRAGFATATLSTLGGLAYLIATNSGWLPDEKVLLFNPTAVWIMFTVVYFASSGLVRLSNTSMNQALDAARRTAQVQEETNRELETARRSLEDQVAARTRDLQNRTQYLQAAIEISRASASILDGARLIQNSVNLIKEQFNLYYTGLFLVEPGGEWAVLQAGTGEAGQRMMARNHRIRIGSGMVGWSIANAQPRIALDVGRDAVRLATSELPETRSEAAIPLRSRGKILGALSVQSSQPSAFGEMEIAVFQSLADQLAIALDNARLLSESQQALQEAQRAQGQLGRRAWQDFLQSTGSQMVSYSFGKIETGTTETAPDLLAARRQVLNTNRPVQLLASTGFGAGETPRPTLLMPIAVRDQVIGVIRFVKEPIVAAADTGKRNGTSSRLGWQPDEIELLESITGQLGVALDSARLYQDTQRQALREQLAGEVTSRIRQTLDIQTVMRTAVEEIQRSLNLPEIVISLAPPEDQA